MEKPQLRSTYRAIRKNFTSAGVQRKSKEIAGRFSVDPSFVPSYILSYQPIDAEREVDPSYITQLYPEASVITAPLDAPHNMLERDFDLILVPMIAGDLTCHRLGFGRGWYDRVLITQPHAIKIGLCYDECVVTSLPSEPHDVSLDAIITENRIITPTVE